MSNLEEKVTKLKQPRTRSRKDKTYNEYVGGGGENRGSFPPTSPTQSVLFPLGIEPDIPGVRPWKEFLATEVQTTWLYYNYFDE
ncbi:hypothetical protein MTR_3g111300 [Medicago truncatula]|uniref:Uncharacterized protein n=1 Tax=Medicago truncatula TaxID=3880 RepID=G7J451_MEDTR|nr:hypothetical protein MTR_3g111300 [Medicago truncatula]